MQSVCGPPGEAPQDEAQAAVRVQADGYLARRVELTLQLNGAAQSADGSVRHLDRGDIISLDESTASASRRFMH